MDASSCEVIFDAGAGVLEHFTRPQPWRHYGICRLNHVVAGQATYHLSGVSVTASAGDMLLILPGRRAISVHPEAEVRWLPFRLQAADGAAALPADWPLAVRYPVTGRSHALMLHVYNDLCDLVLADPQAARAKLDVQLLLDLFQHTGQHRRATIPTGIQEIARRLTLYPGERLTVPEMAARAGVSAPHFSRLFRQHYDLSPAQYAIVRRLEAATRLLSYEQLSVSDCAQRLGYPDAYCLSRQFSQHYGYPPSRHKA